MTNLDSIFKSRDITLQTKVRLVKAMVFPVVMYGCESWTIKKSECEELMLLNCGVEEDQMGWFLKEGLLFLSGNLQWKLVNSLHATI